MSRSHLVASLLALFVVALGPIGCAGLRVAAIGSDRIDTARLDAQLDVLLPVLVDHGELAAADVDVIRRSVIRELAGADMHELQQLRRDALACIAQMDGRQQARFGAIVDAVCTDDRVRRELGTPSADWQQSRATVDASAPAGPVRADAKALDTVPFAVGEPGVVMATDATVLIIALVVLLFVLVFWAAAMETGL